MQCDKYQELLSGFLDHELPPETASEVNEHLIRCDHCRKEYEELRETMKHLDRISFDEPEDKILENLWNKPYHRYQKYAGLFMVFMGYLVLILFGIFEFIVDRSVSLIPKIALGSVLIGLVLLLAMLLRERLATYKVDRYKEIEK